MEITMEEMMKVHPSKYVLVTAMAKRSKAINAGAKILIDDVGGKPETITTQEIFERKVLVTFNPPSAIPVPVSES